MGINPATQDKRLMKNELDSKTGNNTASAPRSIPVVHFDVVRGCQLRCVGCPNSTLQPVVQSISTSDFERCLHHLDVKKIGLFRLFNFGESLLHPDLPGLLAHIPRQTWTAQQIEISTNAQTVHWDMIEETIRLRILTRLVVSCDGDGTPADYERLRPPGRWSKLMNFLAKTRGIRDRLHPGLELMTRTICVSQAGQDLWKSILVPLGWNPEFRPWIPMPESKRLQDNPVPVGKGVCDFVKNRSFLGIDCDGDVVPCCFHPRAAIFGNLKEQPYSAIVAGIERQRFADVLASNRSRVPVCGLCAFEDEFPFYAEYT